MHLFRRRWCWSAVLRVRSSKGHMSPSPASPQPWRARRLSSLAFGLCAARQRPCSFHLGKHMDHWCANRRTMRNPLEFLTSWSDVMAHMRTEATHVAYPACEVVVLKKRGPVSCEATQNAEAACEAVGVSSRMGIHMKQLGAKRRTM